MDHQWWHGKIAYQIYPKSFCDSNGDGVGDLRGIISKLDYLQALGVDIVWLSPIYPSPFVDQGYDISDYTNIASVFGSMDDFDELMREAKARGIEIVMDLVANHCSSEHEWFKKACADLNSEEAGYFYFVKCENGKLPNNLRSYFGGSVWTKIPGHENDDIYYSHYFAKEQPDLNWNNPKLREEIFKLVNFWIDKGVRGFRIDAILSIVKDLSFPSLEPDAADGMTHASKMNAKLLDRIGPYLNELKDRTFKPADCFTVGEVLTVTNESVKEFAGNNGYFSTLFDLSCREVVESAPHYTSYPDMSFKDFKTCVFKTQERYQEVDAFVAPIIENHDEPRGVSYFLPEYLRNQVGAKTIATVHMLLRGIPFIYQGQEIGMTNTDFKSIEEFDDLSAKDEYRNALAEGKSEAEAVALCARHGRDNARTPMLWDDSANAGFTTGKPWLRVHQDYKTLNVKSQFGVEGSTFSYYQKLIKLRKDPQYHETFTYGDFVRMEINDEVVAYKRVSKKSGQTIVIIANSSKDTLNYKLEGVTANSKVLLSANEASLDNGTQNVSLGCGGAIVIEL